MNFTKEITLNKDKVYENSELTIKYTGKLYQNNSEKTFISYGYGNLWDNKNEIELQKTEDGLTATINIKTGTDLQFCFHDDNNSWDNNNSQNYILPILKQENKENVIEFSPIAESEKKLDIDINSISDKKEQTLSFTPVTISSEEIDIYHEEKINDSISKEYQESKLNITPSEPLNTYTEKKLDNTQKNAIPVNTIVTQVKFDDKKTETTFENQVISADSFSEITKKAKENSVRAFDENHITAGSVYVNSLIEDYKPKVTEPPKFIEDITITAMIPVPRNDIAPRELSRIHLIKNKIKLALCKFIKLIKTALNYDENKI